MSSFNNHLFFKKKKKSLEVAHWQQRSKGNRSEISFTVFQWRRVAIPGGNKIFSNIGSKGISQDAAL